MNNGGQCHFPLVYVMLPKFTEAVDHDRETCQCH